MTPIDQVARYLRWFKDCPLNRTEKFFDIGITDRDVLLRFKTSLEFCCGQLRPQNAGNDSIMSRAPVPLFHVFHCSTCSTLRSRGGHREIKGSRGTMRGADPDTSAVNRNLPDGTQRLPYMNT